MGSRTNFEIKDQEGSIWLYSHWGGDSKMSDLAYALEAARPRWYDTSYAVRIVVSQLIGDYWKGELGFGLSTYQAGEESYEPVCVNFVDKTVSSDTFNLDFDSFINIYSNNLTTV